jgi:hypothetical protein
MAMPRNSGDEVRSGQGRIMDYTALASGLIGAAIGALSSWVTLIVQNHYQNRRDRTGFSTRPLTRTTNSGSFSYLTTSRPSP